MPLFLSDPAATTSGYRVNLDDPHQHSRGYRQSIDLPCGINLLIDRYDLATDLFVESASGSEQAGLELSFMVSGDNYSEQVLAGKSFVASYFDEPIPDNTFYWQAGQRILKVDIEISPQFYRSQPESLRELLPLSFDQYLETDDIGLLKYFQMEQTTPAMQMVLDRIVDCPFADLTRQVYLETQCLDLIALRLAATDLGDRNSLSSRPLTAADRDCIYHARSILLDCYDRPPSLLALAQQVNLNDYKLKAGFRQIFGTTVFGYLWAYRMERARDLLYASNMTVQEVAFGVGYSCHGRFSAAFKRRFNMTPTAYRTWRNGL